MAFRKPANGGNSRLTTSKPPAALCQVQCHRRERDQRGRRGCAPPFPAPPQGLAPTSHAAQPFSSLLATTNTARSGRRNRTTGAGRPGSPSRGPGRQTGVRGGRMGAPPAPRLPPSPLKPAGGRAQAGREPGGSVRAAPALPGGSRGRGARRSERTSPPRVRRARPAAAPARRRPRSRIREAPTGRGRGDPGARGEGPPPLGSRHHVAPERSPNGGAAARSRGDQGPGKEDPADARSPREPPGTGRSSPRHRPPAT